MNRKIGFAGVALFAVVVGLFVFRDEERGRSARTDRNPEAASRQPPPRAVDVEDSMDLRSSEAGAPLFPGITGVVTADGHALEGAMVYAYAVGDTPEQIEVPVAEATTSGDGSYRLLIPRRTDGAFYDVGVLGRGAKRQLREDVAVSVNRATEVNFELDSGEWITGRVVDKAGAPVAGLEMFASSKPVIAVIGHRLLSTALLDTRKLRRAARGSEYHESVAISDANGEFVLKGLAVGTYAIVPKSFRWIADPGIKVSAPRNDLRITVTRTRGVSAFAVDAETGSVIPRFSVVLEVVDAAGSPPFTIAGSGLDGRLDLVWLPRFESGAWTAFVRARAEGYLGMRKAVTANSWHMNVGRLALKREGDSKLELQVYYDDGEAADIALRIGYRASEREQRGKVLVKKSAPGVYSAKLPAGQWSIRVYPDGALAHGTQWRGEVNCTKESAASVRVTLPRGGTLEVRRPDNPDRDWAIYAENSTGTTMAKLGAPITKFEHVPPGEWTLKLFHDGRLRGKRVIRIQPRDTVRVEFR